MSLGSLCTACAHVRAGPLRPAGLASSARLHVAPFSARTPSATWMGLRSGTVRPRASASALPLSKLKWDAQGLIPAIVQHVETGEILMQAFCDEAALVETLQTGLATFYSRSRKGRWCKGETSGHFIKVVSVHLDCDHDSLIYLAVPIGPACHTNAPTCYFERVRLAPGSEDALELEGSHKSRAGSPLPTFRALEEIIEGRRLAAEAPGAKPSWTVKLLRDPALLCSKIREEAGELCQTWEKGEGHERTVSEAADLLYHAFVLLNHEGVKLEEVTAELRRRFGMSGLDEKASRGPKQ